MIDDLKKLNYVENAVEVTTDILAVYENPKTGWAAAARTRKENGTFTRWKHFPLPRVKSANGAVVEARALYEAGEIRGFGADNDADRRKKREKAKKAVVDLIEWAGDDPKREGLLKTPERVVRAFEEFFGGYWLDPDEILATSFSETGGYNEMVVLTDIPFKSHCEHHMVPFIGKAHVAYIPNDTVVGISKLARLVDMFARRLQIQEKMTAQIADTLNATLKPQGVAVVIEATHFCMTTRGVKKEGVVMKTSRMLGAFQSQATRAEFMSMIGGNNG